MQVYRTIGPLVSYAKDRFSHDQAHLEIPLIGKDGDDVINNVTCTLMGTESINMHIVNTGNMALNRIKQLK